MGITPRAGSVVNPGTISPRAGSVAAAAPVSTGEDVLRGGASGLAEGTAGLIGLPKAVGDITGRAADLAMEKAGASDDFQSGFRSGLRIFYQSVPGLSMLTSGPESADVAKGISDLTGGYTEYEPKTYAGETVKNIGTMVPAAAAVGLTGGASALPAALTYGAVVPGVAGVAAEKGGTGAARAMGLENPEMYGKGAKLGAELFSPGIAQRALGATRAPMEALAPENAEEMVKAGLQAPTAGQMTRNPDLLAREASSFGFSEKVAQQQKSLLDYAYKKIGWDSKTPPTQQQLDDIGTSIGSGIEQNIGGISYPVTSADRATAWGKEMSRYISGSDVGSRNLIQMWMDDLGGKSYLTPSEINKIRSDAWELSVSPNANRAAKDAAITIGKLADGMIERGLNDAAQFGIVPAEAYGNYLRARKDYANFLAVRGAIENSGRPSAMVFSSDDLKRAADNIPGVSPDFRRIVDHAASYYGGHPNMDKASLMRSISKMGQEGVNALTTGAFSAPAGVAQGAASILGRLGRITHPFTMTGIGQAALKGGAGKASGIINPYQTGAIMGSMPYAQEDRAQRKSGGRVSSHEAAADQLVRAAERAKKGQSAQTEALLNQSDDAVAQALEVANRSI